MFEALSLCHEAGPGRWCVVRSRDHVSGAVSGPGCAGYRRLFYSPAWYRLGYRSCPRDWLWWSPFPVGQRRVKGQKRYVTEFQRRLIIQRCRMRPFIMHGFVRFRTALLIMNDRMKTTTDCYGKPLAESALEHFKNLASLSIVCIPSNACCFSSSLKLQG